MLALLLEVYVDQMNNGGVPRVENAVDTMAQLENSRAMEEAATLYQLLMAGSLTMPVIEDTEFSRCHNNCLQKAIDLFLSKAVFDENHKYQREMNVSPIGWSAFSMGLS